MRYRFIFVCQGGKLETKACVLAASLNSFLSLDYELVAAIPQGRHITQPSHETIEFLQMVGVTTKPITNPLADDYPIGHKLACLTLENPTDKVIFMDSDMLCLKTLHHLKRFEQFDFHAKLEDWHHHEPEHWQTLYQQLGLSAPDMNYRTTVFNEVIPLYFNAGFLAIRGELAQSFAQQWIALANKVDHSVNIPRLRPNLDQLTLPIVTLKQNLHIDLLDETFNFPGELRPLSHNLLPYFCHYHDPHMILCDEVLSNTVGTLCEQFSGLKNILKNSRHTVWKAILANGKH